MKPKRSSLVITIRELRKTGLGEFTQPGIESEIARSILFDSMSTLCIDELTDLQNAVLPSFEALFEFSARTYPNAVADFPRVAFVSRGGGRELLTIHNWQDLVRVAPQTPQARQLLENLVKWATEINMAEEWFLGTAMTNLRVWAKKRRKNSSEFNWRYPTVFIEAGGSKTLGGSNLLDGTYPQAYNMLKHKVPPPRIPSLCPLGETFQQHKAAVMLTLSDYYKRCEEIMLSAGYKKPTMRRTRPGSDPWVGAARFILYQIKGKTFAEIAMSEKLERGIEDHAISLSVSDFAALLPCKRR